jgi:hypothetical protein
VLIEQMREQIQNIE